MREVLVNCEAINVVDTTGADQLIKLHNGLERQGIDLRLAYVKDQVRELLIRSGAEAIIGPENIYAVDLDPQTIGKKKFGVLIRDGRTNLKTLVEHADVLLVTGTTLGNATVDAILTLSSSSGKPCIFYGVTISAAACLLGFERICPCAA